MGPAICIIHETDSSGQSLRTPCVGTCDSKGKNQSKKLEPREQTGNKVYQRNPNRINFFCFSKYKPSLKNLKSRINIITFYIM